MDYVLFWNLNPKKLEPFIEAFKQSMKIRREEVNFSSWLSGVYITHALASFFGKNHSYPQQPISFDSLDEEDQLRQDAQRFEALAISFNQQYRNEHADVEY